jgi:hypothetical protein
MSITSKLGRLALAAAVTGLVLTGVFQPTRAVRISSF